MLRYTLRCKEQFPEKNQVDLDLPQPLLPSEKVSRFIVVNGLRFSNNHYVGEFYPSQHPVSACEHHTPNKNLPNISNHTKATPNSCFITHSAQNILTPKSS